MKRSFSTLIRSNGKGFTLIEILLAVTLFAIVTSAAYGIFSAGIQIWKRTQGRSPVERKAILALEKMGRDIRMTLKMKDSKTLTLGSKSPEFMGTNYSFNLPAVISRLDSKGKLSRQSGEIFYQWNSKTRELCRGIKGATDYYLDKQPVCQTLAREIEKLKFQYWLYSKIGGSLAWYDEWNSAKNGLPRAVQVTVEITSKLKGERTGIKRKYRQTFLIPVAGTLTSANA